MLHPSNSPEQASNTFVERALTYVLGYLFEAREAEAETDEDGDERVSVLRQSIKDDRTLAIKLRADNDFYSQTSQASAGYCRLDGFQLGSACWVLQ